jgi:hypothetical protein
MTPGNPSRNRGAEPEIFRPEPSTQGRLFICQNEEMKGHTDKYSIGEQGETAEE